MLLEVLVALVIAALVLGVLARVFASAWERGRRPMEQVSALSVARGVANGAGSSGGIIARDGQIGRFAYTTAILPFAIERHPTILAPAPDGPGGADKRPVASGGSGYLRQMTITVTAPSGRRLIFETVKFEKTTN